MNYKLTPHKISTKMDDNTYYTIDKIYIYFLILSY